jgi:hypothetical protein
MKTGPQPIQKFNPWKLSVVLPFIVLIVVIILAAWFGYDNRKNSSGSIPAGWTEYKSQKYGFKFAYPGYWGTPSVDTTKGKSGTFYQVNFKTDPSLNSTNKNLSVLINMYSQDYVSILCAQAACPGQTALDSRTIQKNLKAGAATFIKHDDSSYAFLSNVPLNSTNTLSDTQIVDIPKINVSGVIGIYSKSNANKCTPGKFASRAETGCITFSDYNSLQEALKSIHAL